MYLSGMVALLAEGVDRNWKLYVDITDDQVALLAEGVDRNLKEQADYAVAWSRPPRGGRG